MIGAQRNYHVFWSCRTLVSAVGALLLIDECGATRAPHLQLQAAPGRSAAYEDERQSEDAQVFADVEFTHEPASFNTLPTDSRNRLLNSELQQQFSERYTPPLACLHGPKLRGAAIRHAQACVRCQHTLISPVVEAGSRSRRLEEQANVEEKSESLTEAKSTISDGENKHSFPDESKVERRPKLENSLVGNGHGKRNEKAAQKKADASGFKDENQDASHRSAKIQTSGSPLSTNEAATGEKGNSTSAKRLSRKDDKGEEQQKKNKQRKGAGAPPLDPTAPIEELLDPSKIDRRSLIKTPFSKLTVKRAPGETAPSYEHKKKTENEVYQEAQEVYEQAKAVPTHFDKGTDVAEAKVSPPKQLSWYTRFMEAADQFFARWGKS